MHVSPGDFGGQKRVLDPLLELQLVTSSLIWEVGTVDAPNQ